MLALRRNVGQSIVIFDANAEIWITPIDIEMDSVTLYAGPEPGTETDQADNTIEVALFESSRGLLQGDVTVTVTDIIEMSDGSRICTLGITAPPGMSILRNELIKGMSRAQRRMVVR